MIVLVMGTTGSGKTTVGTLIAQRLGWEFSDGDTFHSPANIEKMKHGIPLTDEDRIPWLEAIHHQMLTWNAQGRNGVMACSALKLSYRDHLMTGTDAKLVYLRGSYDLFLQRLHSRKGHFADERLLASQFATLEEPSDGITIDATHSREEMVDEICTRLGIQ
jgi:gluconokinase